MDGRGEDLFRRAAFYDLTLMQNGDALADACNRRQIVRDVEDRHPGLAIEAREQLQNLRLRDDVQRTGCLIRDQEGGPMHDRHGDQHPLRLADAELRSALVEEVPARAATRQTHALQRRLDRLFAIITRGIPVAVCAPGFPELAFESARRD